MNNIITSAKITAIALTMSLAAFFLYAIELAFVSEKVAYMNPLISGFLHQSPEHLFYNLVIIFVAMLNPINHRYGWKFIYVITTIISLLYFPIEFFGLTSAAIGLSGTCTFFLTRAFLKWGKITSFLLIIMAVSESLSLFSQDGTAHGVHIIGIILGIASYFMDGQQKSPELPGFLGI